jgi:5-methylcytosine-specific restriction enzyme subunit McrC
MELVTVFEHEALPVALSDSEKGALSRMHSATGCEVFRLGWPDVRSTSYVGVVQTSKRLIQILPKIYRNEAEREVEATRNLLFFLNYTRKLDVQDTDVSRLASEKVPMAEVLYWIFARRLWDAVQHDFLRGYVPVENRLAVLKGRWLVAKQFRCAEAWRKDRFEVAYDEFTEDNLPNQLFKRTIFELSRVARCRETIQLLIRLREVFSEVNDVEVEECDFERARTWILAHRRRSGEGRTYRPLLNFARMFLSGVSPRMSAGRVTAFAYTFDMNVLFEEFIAEFVKRELGDVCEAHGWNMRTQSATRTLLVDGHGNQQFSLKPDVRFESVAGHTELIVDTKWKRLDATARNHGVSEDDAYQMFAYAQRYKCPRVVLLYPGLDEVVVEEFSSDPNLQAWLEVRTVNLRRDFSQQSEREALRAEMTEILSPKQPYL